MAGSYDIDPDFAPAMAGMAGARFLIELEEDDISADEVVLAHEVALRALRIDSASTEVREVLSLIEQSMPGLLGEAPMIPAPEQPEQTVHVFSMNAVQDTIVFEAPTFDSTWGSAQTGLGERIAERMRSRTMPRDASPTDRAYFEARQLVSAGQYREAIQRLERVVNEAPENSPAWELLARTYVSTGELRDGVQTLDEWRESGAPGAPSRDELEDLVDLLRDYGEEGYWEWHLDRLEVRLMDGDHVSHMELATAHAGMGDDDDAVEHLIAAITEGEPGVFAIRSDPVWDELRSDPRLRELGRQSRFMRFPSGRRPPGG